MKSKKIVIGLVSLFAAFTLSACNDGNASTASNGEATESHSMNMDHSGSNEVPKGLKDAGNPTYKVGSKVMIKEGHMEGMEGAQATIVGAYDTIAYAISYTPEDGGEKVKNHKWVIHEEIPDAGDEPLKPGDEFTIDTDHMNGMDGVIAEIDLAEKTTVYMIDFKLTTNGEKVTNHKWVTEEELSLAK